VSSAGKRLRQARKIFKEQGLEGLAARGARFAQRRFGDVGLDFPLLPQDVADSAQLDLAEPSERPPRSRPLVIGWICSPPAPGSGGHTTMFRMVEALEAAGHVCVVYLYNRYSGDLAAHAVTIRAWWPTVRAEIRDVRSLGLGDALDGCFATSWDTAHVMATRPITTRRFYFVQDFEPLFYPAGATATFAEDTYHFGFRCITVGHAVADILRERCEITADVAEFGCDTDVYRLTNPGPRSGVVFYAKPNTHRRGYELAVLALERFHAMHPTQPIHIFGERPNGVAFPFVAHGRMSPSELNDLYNQTVAGLAMSFTNISLVAEEMLAAGTIAVVNDSPWVRADLHNDAVRWARPSPQALARALSDAVTAPDVPAGATDAARGVRHGWGPAQQTVVGVVEREIYGE